MKTKKILSGLLLSLILLSSAVCGSKEKYMKELEGKEGLFAVLTTEKGEIILELFYKETPMTVANFVGLAEGTLDAAKGKPFYNGLKFHRVISKANGDGQDFMIQGGDPKGNGTGGPGYKFPDEFVDNLVFDKPGKLAMANSGADTNGSQFFITIVPTEWLDHKHTIFGQVISGQNVVNKVQQDHTIKSIKIIRMGADAENFKPTQAIFDKLVAEQKKKIEDEKEAKMAQVIADCNKTANGIYWKTLKKGNGKKVGKGKSVTAEYKGYLVDGTLFDASKEFHPQGHEPLEFTTGAGQMIAGFDEMVQDMEYGETRHMVLPPELAYGSRGYPGVIPGNAYICFDVKVVK